MNDQEQQVMDNMHKQEQQHKKDMQSIIKPVELKTFRAYPFVLIIMATLQVLCVLYGRRFMDFMGLTVGVGPLILIPIILYSFQIVAECYGWQYARQIVWCNATVNIIITIVTFVFKLIPYSEFNHNNLQASYVGLVDTMWVSAAMTGIVVFASDWASSLLMCRIRIKFNGGYFLLRIMVIHCISESILLTSYLVTMPFNGYSMPDTLHVMGTTFIARTISSMLMLPFVWLIIAFIQNYVEKVVAFDTGRDSWNIFHWNINSKSTIHFDAKEWSRLSAIKKKRIDINKIALDYYDDVKLGIDKIFKKKEDK